VSHLKEAIGQTRQKVKEIKMVIVKVGDEIMSEHGQGPIIAITKEWIIHKTNEGYEVALHIGDDYWEVPAKTVEGLSDEAKLTVEADETKRPKS
jgi:hypothetical protein